MTTETPKDGSDDGLTASGASLDHGTASAQKEQPGSIGLEVLEQHDDFDIDDGHDLLSDNDDGLNALMAHERKLSASEQRQLLAMRRRAAEGDAEEEIEHVSGRRHLLWKMYNDKHAAGGSSLAGLKPGVLPGETAQAEPGATPPAEKPVALNDPASPHYSVYEAVLRGVNALEPERRDRLSTEEQARVAATLTANIVQSPGYSQGSWDPSSLKVAISDNGDRVFVVNKVNPGAPDAQHINVSLDDAKNQTIEVSSVQAALKDAPVQKPDIEAPVNPTTTVESPTIPPRSLS